MMMSLNRSVCLLVVFASLLVVMVSARVPIQPPVSLKVQSHAPRQWAPPPSTALPLLQVAKSPEARSAGLYKPDEFPDEPLPRPNVNQEPLPLSPPGTYLHSAVLIQGKMYVYGGIASYEPNKYKNDMWLYDFGAMEYVQLQGNYVPPLPNHAGLSTGEAKSFAPRDVPAMPDMATAPRHEAADVEKLHPDANPVSPFLPKRRSQRPVRVMPLEHIYEKDAHKPTAAGLTVDQIYSASRKPAFERDEAAERRRLGQTYKSTVDGVSITPSPTDPYTLPLSDAQKAERRATLLKMKKEYEADLRKKFEAEAMQEFNVPAALRHPSTVDGVSITPSPTNPYTGPLTEEQKAARREVLLKLKQDHIETLRKKFEAEAMASLPAAVRFPSTVPGVTINPSPTDPYTAPLTEEQKATRRETLLKMKADYEADLMKKFMAEEQAKLGGGAAPRPASYLQTEEKLSLHHKHRLRFLSRTIRSIEDARRSKNPDTRFPGSNPGSVYNDPRFHRDGIASRYATDGRPEQDAATQKHHPNTETPTSAPSNAREDRPHALQDFWEYEFESHSWQLVNVTSSQPLAHSPWLTPQQLNDPVFKDPLPILLPPTRRLHTAVVMKDRMIVFGGVSYNNLILGDLWIFDPAESSWIEASADGPGGSPILPREGHSAVTLKDDLTMLVFGGVSYGFLPFNDLWQYSAVDNAWTMLSTHGDQTLPMQRWLHTAVYHEDSNSMIVFGGITAHYVPLNDVHVYDVDTNHWRLQTCLDTPPFPRMMHTAVTINDIMLVTGGAANNLPMDDMYLLDLKTWRWKELIQTNGYPFARTGATAIVLSPKKRGKETGELEDLSDDAHDPHLQYKVDLEKLSTRKVVGSFSSEGIDSNEEQLGNIRGLDAIAFPEHPVVADEDGSAASQRPMYRYRKHSKNNFYFVLFGGASATSAPQDQTHIEQERLTDDAQHAPVDQQPPF